MTFLSDDELSLLRCALGLHQTNRVSAMRNQLIISVAEQRPEALKSLLDRNFLEERFRPDAPGKRPKHFYAATPAGRVAVEDLPWK